MWRTTSAQASLFSHAACLDGPIHDGRALTTLPMSRSRCSPSTCDARLNPIQKMLQSECEPMLRRIRVMWRSRIFHHSLKHRILARPQDRLGMFRSASHPLLAIQPRTPACLDFRNLSRRVAADKRKERVRDDQHLVDIKPKIVDDAKRQFQATKGIRPQGRPRRGNANRPRMPQRHRPHVVSDLSQINPPISRGPGQPLNLQHRLRHEVEQFVLLRNVAIERSGSAAQFAGNPPHRYRSDSFRVGNLDRRGGDLGAAISRLGPPRRTNAAFAFRQLGSILAICSSFSSLCFNKHPLRTVYSICYRDITANTVLSKECVHGL